MSKKNFQERKKLICDLVNEEFYVPMKEKELVVMLQVVPEDRVEFKKALDELVAENKLQISKRGKYSKAEEKIFCGTYIGNAKGFGFVEVEGIAEDYYVPENCVNGAFHQDKVQIKLLPGQSGKRQEAEVIKILEHGIVYVVGTFERSKSFGFVLPDNKKLAEDIFVPLERSKGAVDGHKVVVEITDYGKSQKGRRPEGKVIEILGHINDPGVDIMSIVKGYEFPTEFDVKQLNQAERVAKDVSEADCLGRKDLRNMQMVTIDGEDAKDLDDAISLTYEKGFYHLGVHIADVTNYVQENSALDKEALKRGTSVYLVDRVIPMLPHILSNGICSLNAGADRLALSCLMKVDENGTVVDYEIAESVICIDKRMSYTEVKKILEDHDTATCEENIEFLPMFQHMEQLSKILRKKRQMRGSIDFNFLESKIILDKEGHPIEIKPYDRNVATKLIEDFMLLANETVAQHFYWLEIPFVYRTHDIPDGEKIQKLAAFIQSFGYGLKVKEEIHPKELQKLLGKIQNTSQEALISKLVLRSMKQARYSEACSGHFGLACEYYCHFTSPIRRYPDLQIHRIIKEQLRGKLSEKRIEHYRSILTEVCNKSSKMERRAEEAERETDKLKKAEYMQQHIGEIYEGVISGITAWGIYVELPNTIEGMIHVASLPGDYFYYDESAYEMVGQATGQKFKLGQPITIQVNGADKVERTIDFILPIE